MALYDLIDNSEVEDAEDYQVTCDDCGALVRDETYSDNDGLCEACWDACHHVSETCKESFHTDEMSEEFPVLCVDCGSTRLTEPMDELNDTLTETVGSWDGDDDELSKMKRPVAYAKRLK